MLSIYAKTFRKVWALERISSYLNEAQKRIFKSVIKSKFSNCHSIQNTNPAPSVMETILERKIFPYNLKNPQHFPTQKDSAV